MSDRRGPGLLPLLPLAEFGEIVRLLADKSVWHVIGIGNAGDTLIHAGTQCLFRKIGTRVVEKPERPDFLVWGGGGNLGTVWQGSYRLRQQAFAEAAAAGIPIVVLPQSATDAGETFPENVRIFARERSTHGLFPHSVLAPDLALAFDDDMKTYRERPARFGLGVFLRQDVESSGQVDLKISIVDPVRLGKSYVDYFRAASSFETIVTDRLHFAIASLLLGRRTVLLPNSYDKNKGVHELWLSRLGCEWGVAALKQALGEHNYDPAPIRPLYEALR